MKLVSAGNQQVQHPWYAADGTITTGGTPQLVLARSAARSFLLLQNTSSTNLFFEFGSARATCTISGGVVNSVTITNAGFNFTKPPIVRFLGGGNSGINPYLGLNQPNGAPPSNPGPLSGNAVATGIANLSGNSVSSITITNGGAGYAIAPYVFIANSDLDPYGCAAPSATAGMLLTPGGSFYVNGTTCTTDPIAVYGATTGQAFVCRWMD